MSKAQDLPPVRSGFRATRPILAVVAVLLAVALRAPLWSTRMESPQYRGEEALKVVVYAGQMRGDLREIKTLNRYIGVSLPESIPELGWAPWILGFMVFVALVSLALPSAGRRKSAIALFVLMLVVLVGGLGLLKQRLEEFGHNRTHSIVARVPDFSPPLLGTAKIANFTVHAGLEYGAWSFLAALFFVGAAAFFAKDNTQPSPDIRDQAAEHCGIALLSRR